MVVATVALLVALGGTGIAAVNNVPLFSVGTPQLKPNAVTSPKVLNFSLLKKDFAPGQLPRGLRGFPRRAGGCLVGLVGAHRPDRIAAVSSSHTRSTSASPSAG